MGSGPSPRGARAPARSEDVGGADAAGLHAVVIALYSRRPFRARVMVAACLSATIAPAAPLEDWRSHIEFPEPGPARERSGARGIIDLAPRTGICHRA
jgi:hypothetical protein